MDKNLIFTICTGRSGTKLLARLCEQLPDVTALHEPDPSFHMYQRKITVKPYLGIGFLQYQKIPAIMGCDTYHYLETTHAVCKGWIELMMMLELDPTYIILDRNPTDVAKSMYKYNSIPYHNDRGWLTQPQDQTALGFVSWQKATPFELCYWYAIDIERRKFYYQRRVKTVSVFMLDLLDFEVFQETMADCNIYVPDDYLTVHTEICSKNQNPVKRLNDDLSEDEIQASKETVWKCVEYYDPWLRESVENKYGPNC